MLHTRWNALGPVILSVLSFITVFVFVQPLAIRLDLTFSLFANRGIGKIAITVLVITHIILLTTLQSKNFLENWFDTNVSFFKRYTWIKLFSLFFIIFFALHLLLLLSFYVTDFATYNAAWGTIKRSLLLKMLFGFIATFFLAWTEELIFRGTFYKFFVRYLCPLESIVWTSIIFMFVHDLANPLTLVTIHWRLGLGLFFAWDAFEPHFYAH